MGWIVSAASRSINRRKKKPAPIIRHGAWAQGAVWMCGEIGSAPGFEFRSVQPVGGRYTDYGNQVYLKLYTPTEIIEI